METVIIAKHVNDLGDDDMHVITLAQISNGRFAVRNAVEHEGCDSDTLSTVTIYAEKAAAEAAYAKAVAG